MGLTAVVLTATGCPDEDAEDYNIPEVEFPDMPVPSNHGACCLTRGVCNDSANRSVCDREGGYWHGIGTDCATGVPVCNSAGPFRDDCTAASPTAGSGPHSLNTSENRGSAEGIIPQEAGCRRVYLDAVMCWTADRTGEAVFTKCSPIATVNTILAV